MYPKLIINLDDLIPGSKYFKWCEALFLEQCNSYAIPNDQQMANIIKQAKELDKIRAKFNSPIIIHSWLRPRWYNEKIGGAKMSAHIDGLATDFHIQGVTVEDAKTEIKTTKSLYKGRGEIQTTNWIHLDLRGLHWF